MKTIISIIPFFLFNSAIANVDIGADIEDDNLLVSLESDNGTLQQNGHFQIFIDTDNNSQTGYSSGDISGADYLLEDGDLYTSTSNSDSWSWAWLDSIDYYDDEIPYYLDKTVALTALSINGNTTIKIGVHALHSNWDFSANYHGSSMQEFLLEQNGSSSSSSTPSPMSVYNQAYQENYNSDTINEILDNASNAYVLIDPFQAGVSNYVSAIKNNGNQVSGYISVGTGENWRSDYHQMAPYLATTQWGEWPGEYFISQTTTGILELMKARIETMANWGLDWVEFDNMDWLDDEYKSVYNLETTAQEARAYVNALCDYTHQKGMKCMAKNSVDGFNNFDGVTYESYNNEKNWWDNQGTRNFLDSGKPVIIIHYNESNCDQVYDEYKNKYDNGSISFICEDSHSKKYKHY